MDLETVVDTGPLAMATHQLERRRNSSLSSTAMTRPTASERSPLLKKQPSTSYVSLSSGSISTLPPILPPNAPASQPRYILALVLLTIATFSFADAISAASQKRIYESILCYQHYSTHDPSALLQPPPLAGPGAINGVPEPLCKGPEVQSRVAELYGWQFLFDGLPSLLLAVPLGILADRIGRKPVLVLGLFSFFLRTLWIQIVCFFWRALPLKLVWLSALHGLLSGGSGTLTSILLVVVSDVTDSRNRAMWFMRVSATNMMLYFVGPMLGAALMRATPWAAMAASDGLYVLVVALQTLLPETKGYTHPSLEKPALAEQPYDRAFEPEAKGGWTQRVVVWIEHRSGFLWRDLRIPALILPFVALMMSSIADELQTQYASKRLGVSIARATMYIAVGHGMKVVVLIGLVPAVSALLTERCGFSARRKDLFLAKWSPWLAGIGWMALGFARSLPPYVASMIVATLGFAGAGMARSFITTLVKPDDVAKLYSIVSIVDTLALMASGPLLAGAWSAGLRIGEAAYGLPFWVMGGTYLSVALTLCFVGMKKSETEHDESVEDEMEGPLGR